MAVISTRTHGIIDYMVSAAFFATPRLLGWDKKTTRLMDGAAALSTVYAHLTDYEMGAYPLLSMKQHLAIDALEGGAFLAAAWMLDDEPQEVRAVLAGYGLFALAAGAMTERQPKGHPGDLFKNSGGQRTKSGAWVMVDEDEEEPMHLPEGRARLAESEWRNARGPEYERHIAELNRSPGHSGGAGDADLRAREWQRARPDASAAQRAAAGANTHPSDGKLGARDARRGYMAGQGI